jgi:hypothetical protein
MLHDNTTVQRTHVLAPPPHGSNNTTRTEYYSQTDYWVCLQTRKSLVAYL